MSTSTQCLTCKHYTSFSTCDAFPDGIPQEIFDGRVIHTEPYPGDGGIMYDPIDVELTPDQMVKVVSKLEDKGLLGKFEIPDELLDAVDIDPKKMSPEALKAMFAALKEKGLLKDKPGDKKSPGKESATKESNGAQGSGRPGLVKKKVTVKRNGKTSEEYRWVKAGEDEPAEKPKKGDEKPGEKPGTAPEPEKPKGPIITGLNKPEGEDKESEDVKEPETEEKEPDKEPEDKEVTTKEKPEKSKSEDKEAPVKDKQGKVTTRPEMKKFEMNKENVDYIEDSMDAGLPDSVHDWGINLVHFKDGNKAIHKQTDDPRDGIAEVGYAAMAKDLGWNVVPQVEEVDLGDGEGTCHAFIKGKSASISKGDGRAVIKPEHFEDLASVFVMDTFVGNSDRHHENIMISDDGNQVWAIDNDTCVENVDIYEEDRVEDTFLVLKCYCDGKSPPCVSKMLDWMSESMPKDQFKDFSEIVDTKLSEILKNRDMIKTYYEMKESRGEKGFDNNIKQIEEYLGEKK